MRCFPCTHSSRCACRNSGDPTIRQRGIGLPKVRCAECDDSTRRHGLCFSSDTLGRLDPSLPIDRYCAEATR
jgi:hypothetical protein